MAALEGSHGHQNLMLSYTLLESPEYFDKGGILELGKEWYGSMGNYPVAMISTDHPHPSHTAEIPGRKMDLGRYPKRNSIEGKPPFYENTFTNVELTIDMFYPADEAETRPTVFYISGWHNYHSEQVYSLLYFIASHGYNAVHIPYKDTLIFDLKETVLNLPDSFKNKIDTIQYPCPKDMELQ